MTIRIFVGCPANNEDLEFQAVLEYGLRSRSSEPIELEWMKLSNDPSSFWYSEPQRKGWKTTGWATPFSPFRWAVPERCNFEGRAIYMDIDMIPLDDIAKLWNTQLGPDQFAVAKNEKTFCCTLFDCARAKRFLPSAERLRSQIGLYRDVRRSFTALNVKFFDKDNNWNCLDGEQYKDARDPRIKVFHYTMIPTQPQLKYALPRLKAKGQRHWYQGMDVRPHPRPDAIRLFDEELKAAKAAGYLPENYETPTVFGDYRRNI